jgi:hypothetical protein
VYPDDAEPQQKIPLFGDWIVDERKDATDIAPACLENPTHRAPSGQKLHLAAKRPLKQIGKVAGGYL